MRISDNKINKPTCTFFTEFIRNDIFRFRWLVETTGIDDRPAVGVFPYLAWPYILILLSNEVHCFEQNLITCLCGKDCLLPEQQVTVKKYTTIMQPYKQGYELSWNHIVSSVFWVSMEILRWHPGFHKILMKTVDNMHRKWETKPVFLLTSGILLQ